MKERYITRTIKGTDAQVKIINLVTDEISVKEYHIPFVTDSKTEIKKYIEQFEIDNAIAPLVVIEQKEVEQLYAMRESYFIAHAIPVTDRASIKDIGEG